MVLILWSLTGCPPSPVTYRRAGHLGGISSWWSAWLRACRAVPFDLHLVWLVPAVRLPTAEKRGWGWALLGSCPARSWKLYSECLSPGVACKKQCAQPAHLLITLNMTSLWTNCSQYPLPPLFSKFQGNFCGLIYVLVTHFRSCGSPIIQGLSPFTFFGSSLSSKLPQASNIRFLNTVIQSSSKQSLYFLTLLTFQDGIISENNNFNI